MPQRLLFAKLAEEFAQPSITPPHSGDRGSHSVFCGSRTDRLAVTVMLRQAVTAAAKKKRKKSNNPDQSGPSFGL